MIQYPAVAVAISIGAVPVDFALEINPDDGMTLEHFFLELVAAAAETNPVGKTLEHFFLVVVESVPFPFGAPVETGIGTIVAVLKITTALPEVETALT